MTIYRLLFAAALFFAVRTSAAINAWYFPQDLPKFSSISCERITSVAEDSVAIYVGSPCGLEVSFDGGVTFLHRTVRNGLATHCLSDIHSVSPSELYVKDCDGGVYFSENQGVTFQAAKTIPIFPVKEKVSADGLAEIRLVNTAAGSVTHPGLCYYSLPEDPHPYCFSLEEVSLGFYDVYFNQVIRRPNGNLLLAGDYLLEFNWESLSKGDLVAYPGYAVPRSIGIEKDRQNIILDFSYGNVFFLRPNPWTLVKSEYTGCPFYSDKKTLQGYAIEVTEGKSLRLLGTPKGTLDLTPALPSRQNIQVRFTGDTAWDQALWVRTDAGVVKFTGLP